MDATRRGSRGARRTAGLLAAVVLLVGASAAPNALAATRISGTQMRLLSLLRVATEHVGGYQRTLFRLWIDADRDGCNTRREVLIAESRTAVTVGPSCWLSGGTWRSAYDGVTTTNPSSFDIDHVVPLKEAWDSGAWSWTAARRMAYANDLGDWRSLRAVSASSNRAKADADPAGWLPLLRGFRCAYAAEWVAVKVRWSLSIDAAEKTALWRIFRTCAVRTIAVWRV